MWTKGAYIKGVPGISGASVNADRVNLQVASGRYSFRVKGSGL